MLLIYTDGITEAMNSSREMLDEQGLFDVAVKLRNESARDAAVGIVEATHGHAGDAPQSDDITILSVRIKASDQDSDTGDAR